MSPLTVLCALFLLGVASSAEALKCNEGFNMSLSGIPMYHWNERSCKENSKCFGQELMVKLPLGDLKFDVAMTYGACLSSAYADHLDCEKLFGPTSKFDLANLLDLIPDIANRFEDTINDFVTDSIAQIQLLFSNGNGASEFIDGIFVFSANMGFDMTKAEPLKPTLSALLEKSLSGNRTEMEAAASEFFNAFANLDTSNAKLTNALKKLISVFDPNNTSSANPMLSPLIEKGPGLIRDILPKTWNVSLWYDVIFELFEDIDASNWTKTAENMVATIKSSYSIPADVLEILNPLFDRIPNLVAESQTNPSSIGSWSLELMKAYSEVDDATTAFANALIKFVESIANTTLQQEFRTTIEWMPGLFYKAFPGDKAAIQDVYRKMAAGFDSFDFTNISDTAQPSKLSDMVIMFVEKGLNLPMDAVTKAIVVNSARMFYNLLPDYNAYVDIFADVLSEELKNYPTFNAGQIVKNLITGMNGSVPAEIDPLLTNIQAVITAAMENPFNQSNLFVAFTTVIDSYKTAFPNSPFPELVGRCIDIIKSMTELRPDDAQYNAKLTQSGMEFVYWSIDLQFALFSIGGNNVTELDQMLIKAFPGYETIIKLLRTMKAEDVKEFAKKIVEWAFAGVYTPESFVAAVKPTVQKITASIVNLLRDFKKLITPDSCRFGSCATDLCNTQMYISETHKQGDETTKPPTTSDGVRPSTMSDEGRPSTTSDGGRPSTTSDGGRPSTTSDGVRPSTTSDSVLPSTTSDGGRPSTTRDGDRPSTTSDGGRVHFDILLNIATLWMVFKVFCA